MAYLGSLVFFVAALGAFLYWRGKLARSRWYLWTTVWIFTLPFLAALAGWVLTEVGRQPWIVYGLLRTSDANSPSVSTTWLWTSLGVFAVLYGVLTLIDIVLLRRYSDPDRDVPGPDSRSRLRPAAAISY